MRTPPAAMAAANSVLSLGEVRYPALNLEQAALRVVHLGPRVSHPPGDPPDTRLLCVCHGVTPSGMGFQPGKRRLQPYVGSPSANMDATVHLRPGEAVVRGNKAPAAPTPSCTAGPRSPAYQTPIFYDTRSVKRMSTGQQCQCARRQPGNKRTSPTARSCGRAMGRRAGTRAIPGRSSTASRCCLLEGPHIGLHPPPLRTNPRGEL